MHWLRVIEAEPETAKGISTGILQQLFGRKQGHDTQWQVPLVQEICVAMIRLVPQDWNSVALVLEVTERGLGSGLSHSAITPTPVADFHLQDPHFVTPDAQVIAATRQLELAWVEHRGTFKRAIIMATRDAQGGWDIRSEYEHEDD